ncbi:MAG TPA: outer membrane beta-barrel protein [Bryobacteraceae bacterium]|nr:outer membrane beta-barrel protein [Bryobacteraceae bacterium]
MRSKLAIAAIVALGTMSSLYAQDIENFPVKLGLKVGIPITDMFSANNVGYLNGNIPGSTYNAATPKYILGVSGEFHLYKRFRLEVDGLYKRTGFSTSGLYGSTGSNFYQSTGANIWEVPVLLKTNISIGHVRPFVDFGASLRHVSSIQNNQFLPGIATGIITDNVNGLHNRNSYGGVAGIGITFKRGPVEISPEVRYTRWANESFQTNGLRTNLDQGDFLLGISF